MSRRDRPLCLSSYVTQAVSRCSPFIFNAKRLHNRVLIAMAFLTMLCQFAQYLTNRIDTAYNKRNGVQLR